MMQLDSSGAGGGRWRRAALATGLGVLLASAAHAQQAGFFRTDAAARPASPLAAALPAARPLSLDVAGLRAALATAPLETMASARPLLLTLPLPDGTSARYQVVAAPVMAPALAARFPDITTYAGVGLDDARATVRLDLTPRGFHAQVQSPTTGTFFIDPSVQVAAPTPASYLSFWKRDMPAAAFACGVVSQREYPAPAAPTGAGQRSVGPTLRTYRLAVAATGEYTAYQSRSLPTGATDAQKIAATQAAIVTTVNRVVGVYEKELAVRLVLVANNPSLIYLDAATDPYTNDNPNGELLDENQATVDALIGPANYDIGHVFSTAGGGLAGLGVVCQAGQKAQGETGTDAPVGDAFDIDYVAHEMGHQFGANHTFNGTGQSCGDGNRNAPTAYEPGSGTTIMAYAGICGPANDVQSNSDAYFHIASFDEIQTYLATTSCAVSTAISNNQPTVAGLPVSGKVLPVRTPFKLTARAYDADGDALTYCWEEFDLGTGGSPTATQTANNNVALFRSFYPTTSPTRYFPRLSNIIANTTTLGERLPTVSRTLTFRVTLRDRFTTANTGFGTVGGVANSLPVTMTTNSAAGPFVVTYPNASNLSLAGGSSPTVTWDVAGTTANGVNCASVNILLSTDGGLTYPTTLLANTPNDGSQDVPLPSVATTTARILVEAADNYFFDISNQNFTITTATPCGEASALTVSSLTSTSASVSFTAGAAATGYTITTVPATTTQTVTGTSAALTGLTAGTTYTVYVTSTCAGSTTATAASATFTTLAPATCSEVTDLRVTGSTATSLTIAYTAPANPSSSYLILTVPATTTQTVTGTTATLTGLTAGVQYTVYVQNSCTSGGVAVASFLAAVPPANDNCATAISLTPAPSCAPVTGTTVGATPSTPAVSSSCYGGPINDVWYSFVATRATHIVRVATTAIDVVVQLVGGSCASPTAGICVDATDIGTENLSLTNLTVGTRYQVRVFPYGQDPGTFTICVLGPAPLAGTAALELREVSVVPNPAQGSFAVQLPAVAGQRPVQATLLTVLGQPVLSRPLTAGTTADFDVQHLARGVYVLRLTDGNQSVVRRVVLE